MIVISIDNAPENLRGELTKWLLEIKPGVFVGKVNATVREILWEKVCERATYGAVLVYSYNTEQGFDVKLHGTPRREVVDVEGIKLIKIVN